MKKILLVLLILTLSVTGIFAEGEDTAAEESTSAEETAAAEESGGVVEFAFEDARFHDDLLFGLAPVYVRAGINYTGFEIIEDQHTDFYIIGGGALVSANVWTDQSGATFEPSSVDNTTEQFKDFNSYSRWQADFSLKLNQGFIQMEDQDKPFLAAYAKYAFNFTSPHENWKEGAADSNFLSGLASAYPDQAGDITNSLQIGAELDRLDSGDVCEGYNVNLSALFAPRWFANNLYGDSNFLNVNLTAKGYLTLLDLKRKDSELTALGIYLADRIQVDYLAGDAIPQFYQEGPSLGSKMRGFEGNSMGTEFTIVNNFDVRIYGIEFLDNLNPILNLFLDAGFFAGRYNNTNYIEQGSFRLSTGFEVALNIVDFAQIGYMFGFPLVGENLQQELMQGGIMFQYKF